MIVVVDEEDILWFKIGMNEVEIMENWIDISDRCLDGRKNTHKQRW